jgi:hypothetical protein
LRFVLSLRLIQRGASLSSVFGRFKKMAEFDDELIAWRLSAGRSTDLPALPIF